MYAITGGKHLGDFFVFTEDKPQRDTYKVIVLPHLEETVVPAKDVDEGLKLKILDYVDKLSKSVYNELAKQIEIKKQLMLDQQKKAVDEYNSRREQLTPPGILGCDSVRE